MRKVNILVRIKKKRAPKKVLYFLNLNSNPIRPYLIKLTKSATSLVDLYGRNYVRVVVGGGRSWALAQEWETVGVGVALGRTRHHKIDLMWKV